MKIKSPPSRTTPTTAEVGDYHITLVDYLESENRRLKVWIPDLDWETHEGKWTANLEYIRNSDLSVSRMISKEMWIDVPMVTPVLLFDTAAEMGNTAVFECTTRTTSQARDLSPVYTWFVVV